MIQPLELNLSSAPFRNNILIWVSCGLAVALLAIFTLWNVYSYNDVQRSLGSLEDSIETLDQKFSDLNTRQTTANREISKFDLESLEVRAFMANEVIGSKAFSWTLLFNHMEEVLPWNVQMVSIHPIFRKGRQRRDDDAEASRSDFAVVVEGVSKDLLALLDFERALFAHNQFDRPEPDQHEVLDTGEVGFSLKFTYFTHAMTDGEPVLVPAETGEETAGLDVTAPGIPAENSLPAVLEAGL
jgi:hypothetical protein